jgi:hypothetical protein
LARLPLREPFDSLAELAPGYERSKRELRMAAGALMRPGRAPSWLHIWTSA